MLFLLLAENAVKRQAVILQGIFYEKRTAEEAEEAEEEKVESLTNDLELLHLNLI